MRDPHPKTGHPLIDAILLAWGAVVAIVSQLQEVQAALGVIVAILTIILLALRIAEHIRDLNADAEPTD